MVNDQAMTPEVAAAESDPLREQLLDAASRVFASKGYSGTKIMDIVKAAGLSAGAVYGRFESKNDLLMEAVLRAVERNALASRVEGKTVAEALVEASQATGELDDSEAMRLEAYLAARREPQVADAIGENRRRWRTTITQEIIDRAIADGTASPDADFDTIVYFVETLNIGLLVQRGAGQTAPDPEAWQSLLARLLESMARP